MEKDNISRLELEIAEIKALLISKQKELCELQSAKQHASDKLSSDDIVRFSRQIILPQIGLEGMCIQSCGGKLIWSPDQSYFLTSGCSYDTLFVHSL